MIVVLSSSNKLSFSALITNAGKVAKKSGWITIRGTHVKLEGGVVVAGPKALKDLVGGGKPAGEPVSKPAAAEPAGKPAASDAKPSGRPAGVMDPKDVGKGVSSEQVDTKKSREMAIKYKSLQN